MSNFKWWACVTVFVVGYIGLNMALWAYEPAVEPVEPVETASRQPRFVDGLKTDERVVDVTKADKIDVVKENPQGCDHATQWIWADGSCHDKETPKQPVKLSEPTTMASDDCYRAELAKYDWDVATMQRIMRAESGCNPTNHNYADNHGSCLGSYGLLQIGCVHGYSQRHLSDPVKNIKVAYQIYATQGISAWGAYSNGSYLNF